LVVGRLKNQAVISIAALPDEKPILVTNVEGSRSAALVLHVSLVDTRRKYIILVVLALTQVVFPRKFHPIQPQTCELISPQVDPVRKRWVSRPRLFQDEAGNIGSQLIAITLLQQEDCVHRSAEKAAPNQRKDALAHRGVGDAFIERVKPSLVQRANRTGSLPKLQVFRRNLACFAIFTKTHRSSPRCRVLCGNYSQIPGFLSIKIITFRDYI
jgi:hypothetical protein